MVTAHYSIFPKTLANSLTKETHVQRKVVKRLVNVYVSMKKVLHERSKEAMFGTRNDFKRNRKTPP